jgi:hypothetical protein
VAYELTDLSRRVLMLMLARMRGSTGIPPSYDEIAEICEIDAATIRFECVPPLRGAGTLIATGTAYGGRALHSEEAVAIAGFAA